MEKQATTKLSKSVIWENTAKIQLLVHTATGRTRQESKLSKTFQKNTEKDQTSIDGAQFLNKQGSSRMQLL